MKNILLICTIVLVPACTFLPFTNQTDETDNSEKLPLINELYQGTLANGLQYIVLPNDKPEKKLSLQLVIKAGSLHEQDDQQGIAHLVEHMAFNGTQQYPSNSIIERQEALGMVFGRDVNAMTSFNTTSYYLHLPSNDDKLVDEAFNMLAQQVSALTFDQQELENERPVVEEEWRRSLNMRTRLRKANSQITKANSRYIERAPIGDMALVRHVDANRIKDFWLDWYHPNNMVLIAVGATSEQQIKDLLAKYFQKLPAVKLPPLPNKSIPLVNKVSFDTISESQLSTETVTVNFRKTVPVITSKIEYKQQLTADLAISLLSDRLRYQYQAGSDNISNISVSSHHMAPGYENTNVFAILKNESYTQAVEEIFLQISRYATHGFLTTDLEPVKRVLDKSYQTIIDNDSSVKNAVLVTRLFSKIRYNLPLTSSREKAKIAQQLLQEITLEQVNQYLQQLVLTLKPMVIAQIKPENRNKQPTAAQVKTMWEQALANPPEALKGITVDAPLFTQALADVEVVAYKKQGEIHIWTLKNNNQVWFQPSDRSPDSLLIKWQGLGGTQHLPLAESRVAQLAVRNISRFGYANFDPLQLEVLNAGKSFSFGASVNQLQHQISGNSTKDSFEAWLQNFYLQLSQPQVNAKIWQSKKQLMLKGLAGADKSPQYQFSKELTAALYPENSILQPLTVEELSPVSADNLLPAWQSIFNNAGQHKLLIIGNAEPEWVINQAARYVGNLPVGTVQSELILPKLAQQPKKVTVYAGSEPKATTELFWVIDQEYSQSTKRAAGILSKIINLRMRAQLREKAGGVYSSTFKLSMDRSRAQLFASLSYSHQPERAQELKTMALQVISDAVKNGITQKELDTVREQLRNSLQVENLRDSQKLGWMSQFARFDKYQTLPDHYLNWLSKVTPAQLKLILQRLLATAPTIEAVLLPEK